MPDVLSEQLYRALLVIYPRKHRREYGELMVQLFRDRMRRDGGGFGSIKVWFDMLVDLVTSALKEHSNGGSMTAGLQSGGSTGAIVVCAAMLFFGFKILQDFIAAPLVLLDFGGDCCRAPMVLWANSNVSYFAPFILLVVSYPFVRRLRHDLLSHLWLFVIIVGVSGLITVLPALGYLHSMGTFAWLITISGPGLVAMVWFARKLSAASFRHSLLFIGLATVLGSPGSFIPPYLLRPEAAIAFPWPPHIYVTLLIGGTFLRGLAVWALIQEQAVTSSTRAVLPLLVTMGLLTVMVHVLATNVWVYIPVYSEWIIIPTLMVPALAAVATYAVRVRGPGEPQPRLASQCE